VKNVIIKEIPYISTDEKSLFLEKLCSGRKAEWLLCLALSTNTFVEEPFLFVALVDDLLPLSCPLQLSRHIRHFVPDLQTQS
jgi:hypothetical protein